MFEEFIFIYRMHKKIVVVDDELAILEVLSVILKMEGYDTQTFSSGERLVEKLEHNTPDLILLDFSLPGETGDSIARKLKSHKETHDVPIIMLSAHHAIEQTALASGVNLFIPKPFSIDTLINAIHAVTRSFVSPKVSF